MALALYVSKGEFEFQMETSQLPFFSLILLIFYLFHILIQKNNDEAKANGFSHKTGSLQCQLIPFVYIHS